ncbi:MAG: hypothetical protein HXY18_04525 [Bryobacteraceae bacterium]|nr:hypothetical protein [Bryobacteraceae bacterium]
MPTGTYLRPGWCKAYVVPAEGGVPKAIRPEFSNTGFPLWLPDGRLVFLGMREAGQPSLEVVDWWTTPLEGGEAIKSGFSAAAEKLGLKGVFQADSVLPAPVPEAVHPREVSVLFHARAGDGTHLWHVPFSLKSGRIAGPPRRLTLSASSDAWPAVWADGSRIGFSCLQTNVDIWSLPVDPSKGAATGVPERLTDDLAEDLGQDLSSDGALMAFMRMRSNNSDLWLKDLRTKRETPLVSSPFFKWYPIFAPGSARIVYPSVEGPGRFSAFVMGRGDASPGKICGGCGVPSGWSSDGQRLLMFSEPDTANSHLAVLDLGSRRVTRLVGGPGRRLYGGDYPPDGKWILFLEISEAYAHIHVAPERDLSESNWIRVTADETTEDKQCWPADGRLIYFVSHRDGFRCIWARPFNPAAPGEGKPFPVFHSHQARRSIANVPLAPLTLAVAAGRLTFSQNEWTANIWMIAVKK